MIPRKLAETVFRNWWLAILPALIAPALVLATQRHAVVFESSATAWVAEGSPFPQESTRRYDPDATLASDQVQVIVDLLSTRAFREEAAELAGLTTGADSSGARALAGEYLGRQVAVFAAGPNLVALEASADRPDEAQKMVAAVIAAYERRLKESADERATVSVAFFASQVRTSQDELVRVQSELQTYRNTLPAAAVAASPEFTRLQSRVDAQVRVVERLVEALTQAELNAASGAGAAATSFTVQDVASLPSAPLGQSMKDRATLPAAAVVLGALFGCALLYLRYRGDHSIRSAEDVAGLGVPILAHIPELNDAVGNHAAAGYLAGLRPSRRDLARRAAAAISPFHSRIKAAS
ncbi:MAG: hypothetical protein ACKVVT_10130 [Dehalococcoidia bacterium]